jgi:hypothetical protein
MIRLYNDKKYRPKAFLNKILFNPNILWAVAIHELSELKYFIRGIIYYNPNAKVDDIYNFCLPYVTYFYDGYEANKDKNHLSEKQLYNYINIEYEESNLEYNDFLINNKFILNNKYCDGDWFEYHKEGFYAFDCLESMLRERITINDMALAINGLIYLNKDISFDDILSSFKLLNANYNESTLIQTINTYIQKPKFELGAYRNYKIHRGDFIIFNSLKIHNTYNSNELSKEIFIKSLKDGKCDTDVKIILSVDDKKLVDNYNSLKKIKFPLRELLESNLTSGNYKYKPDYIKLNLKDNQLEVFYKLEEYSIADKLSLF